MADTTTTSTVVWTGASGTQYTLYLYPLYHSYREVQGVYIFCRLRPTDNKWHPVYIGEAADLNDRLYLGLESHHRWDCIKKNGATHICAMATAGSTDQGRINIETDLRQGHPNSDCNKQ